MNKQAHKIAQVTNALSDEVTKIYGTRKRNNNNQPNKVQKQRNKKGVHYNIYYL